MKKLVFPLLLVLIAVVFSGCGAAPEPVEFTIEMSEFAYSPDTIELKVGQEVTLHLVNNGALSHEFMAGKDPIKNADGQFVQYDHDFFHHSEPKVTRDGQPYDHDEGMSGDHEMDMGSDDHSMSDDHGFMVGLAGNQPGSITTITFTVTDDMLGEWEMGCFLDGGSHYISGMNGKIIVTP